MFGVCSFLLVQIIMAESGQIHLDEASITSASDKRVVLRVSAVPNGPFFLQNEKGDFSDGIEYRMIQTMAKRLNMTISYRISTECSRSHNQLILK